MATPPPPSSVWMVDGDGRDVQVAPDQVRGLLASGGATFREDQVVPVQTDKGVVEMGARDAMAYLGSAEGQIQGNVGTARDVERARLEAELGGVGGQLAAAGYGAARAATFGGSDALLTALGGEQTRERIADLADVNRGATLLGEGLGMVAPLALSGGTSLVGRAATAVPRLGRAIEGALGADTVLARLTGSTVAGAVEGSLYGVGQAVSESTLRDVPLTAERIVAAMGHGALLGGGFSGGASALGALMRGGGSALGEVGTSLLGKAETRAAELGSELSAAAPKTEGLVQTLASKGEREAAMRAIGADARQLEQLRGLGPDVEARVLRMHGEDIGGGALRSIEERAAGAQRLAQEAEQKVASLATEMEAAGARADLGKVASEFRASRGITEVAGLERDATGRFLRRPEDQKAMQEIAGTLDSFEKLGAGDVGKATEMQARLARQIEAGGSDVVQGLRRDLAQALEAEVTRVGQEAQAKLGPDFAARWSNAQAEQKASAWLADATAQGALKPPKEVGLEEIGKAAVGSLTGGGGLGGVPLAIGGTVLQGMARKYGADVVSRLARAATTGEAVHAIDRAMERIAGDRVRSLVGAGSREAGAPVSGLAVDVDRAVRREQPAEPQTGRLSDRFKARRDELTETLSTRNARLAAATAGLDDVAPGLGAAVRERVVAVSDFLASKMPKAAQRASLQPHLERERLPSDSEMARYLRYERAASDPLSVLDDARKGTLRREGSETLRVLYPAMYQGLLAQTLADVAEKKERLGMQERVQLALLFPELPVDPSMSPKAIRTYQSVQHVAPSPYVPPQGAQGSAPTPAAVPLKPSTLAPRSDQIGA